MVMSLTPSAMLPLGTPAPDFELPDPAGRRTGLADFQDFEGLVVAFICNHCPYVVHIRERLVALAREYQDRGIGFVAINANDIQAYPADAPHRMAELARELDMPFPYLYDQDQQTAKAFGAVCTPDFYLFDAHRRLVYRGQFDDSRPGSGQPVTGKDLRDAMDALLAHRPVSPDQKPSVGCSIKWKPGNEPA
jgi:peroxiredoxin